MELENCLDRKKFEGTIQITHDLTFKAENGDVFEIKKEKVAVNDYNREEFGVAQITRVFIKDEYDQSISMEDADTVSDRTYNAHDTKANFNHVFVTSERVFKIEDSKIEVQKDTDNKYKITESSDLMTIKNEEDDVQRFTNENKKVVSDWTANENESLKSWIKCETVEELKLENDLDSETFGITGITEEYIIKNENDQILEHPISESGCRPNVCIHCNATFRYKRTLDNHIINKHPEYIASVSSKINECKYCEFKTALKSHFNSHMRKHPGVEGECELKTCIHCNATFTCNKNLDDHTIKKHPEYIASVSSKIHECKYCIFKTTSKDHFTRHMGKHSVSMI